MMKQLIVLVIVMLCAATVFGQAPGADSARAEPNSLSFGLGGGGLIGVSYDRRLWDSETLSVNASLGAGYLIFGFGFPQSITLNYGKTHHLEVGVVGTFLIVERFSLGILGPADEGIDMTYRVSPLVGYRRQPPGGGMVFRAYFSPFMHNDSTLVENDNSADFTFIPWGGVTFGFSF